MIESSYLLGPGSVSWRLMKERVILLGAGRMLMMQMSDPAVAAGVELHSNYITDPWSRVRRTTDFYLRLVHSRSGDIVQLRSWLQKAHRGISGSSEQGVEYDASADKLMLWVHATVADSVLWSYQQVFGDLSQSERSRYFQEQRILALALGISADIVPLSLEEWESYIRRQNVAAVVGEGARQVWQLMGEMPVQSPRRIPASLWRVLRRPVATATISATAFGMPDLIAFQLGIIPPRRGLMRRRMRLLGLLVRLAPPELRYSARASKAQADALSGLGIWQPISL